MTNQFQFMSSHRQLNTTEVYTEMNEENEELSYKDTVENHDVFGALDTDYRCNKFIYNLFDERPLNILELGCGGGQFTADFIKDGHNAFGLDGRPGYTKYVDLAPNWYKYPNNFFSCDVGKPFSFQYNNINKVTFDVITSWECFEHICADDIDGLFENIDDNSHIASPTFFIGSISYDDNEDGHRVIEDRNWWLNRFKAIGFIDTGISINGIEVRKCPKSENYVLRRN